MAKYALASWLNTYYIETASHASMAPWYFSRYNAK